MRTCDARRALSCELAHELAMVEGRGSMVDGRGCAWCRSPSPAPSPVGCPPADRLSSTLLPAHRRAPCALRLAAPRPGPSATGTGARRDREGGVTQTFPRTLAPSPHSRHKKHERNVESKMLVASAGRKVAFPCRRSRIFVPQTLDNSGNRTLFLHARAETPPPRVFRVTFSLSPPPPTLPR